MNFARLRSQQPLRGLWRFLFAFLILFGAVWARAQAPEADPPGRVGRVAETFGQVWLYSPDTGEWIGALRNRPVTTGDRLATDNGARVEIDLGSTTLRLDSGSELEVQRLDDNQVSLFLHNGSAALRVRDAQAVGEFEMMTNEGHLSVLTPGRYRFDRFDQSTHLTVYAGQARYEGPGSALTVDAGQRGQFWLEPNGAAQYSVADPVGDAFASWNSERDRSQDRVASARFVSPEMTGARDLDRYGRWEQSPEYGAIWFPRVVASGWAPYSTGHWAWVRPWGWTWVDDAPWGFAPFHYGRWVYYRNAWCWAPGTFVRRPVYAPALVAWVGGSGASFSVSVGGGPAVGWFPLAPREVYVPAYRVSPRYVRDVNYTHVRNIPNVTAIIGNPNLAQRDYTNRKYPHAVTVVPANVLSNREPVAPSAARLRDLPAVRAIVNEPGRVAAMLTPPVQVAPAISPRGVEARPFRQPGDGSWAGRGGRPGNAGGPVLSGAPVPPSAIEDTRRGPRGAAPAGGLPNPTEQARRGPVVVPTPVTPPNATDDGRRGVGPAAPQMRANPDDRRGRDHRDGNMQAQALPARPAVPVVPSAQPQAVPTVGGGAPGLLPRPTPLVPPAAPQAVPQVAPQAAPPVAPGVRAAPPAVAQRPAVVESHRERGRPEAAPMRPSLRPESIPSIVPAQPRVAPVAPQVVPPRPARVEPPTVAPAVAPPVRPVEAPRARAAPEEGRSEGHRPQGRPVGGPPGDRP